MSSSREQVLRYGSNQISGYSGNRKTLSITPTSVLLPPIEIDHMDMPATFKDKDVSADTIVFSSNDSTHAQTIAASGDFAISASTGGKSLTLSADTSLTASSDSATLSATTDANVTTSAGDTTISASGSVKLTGTNVSVTGTLQLPQTTGSTGILDLADAGYYTANLTTDTNKGLDGYTCKLKMIKIGSLVTFELRGSAVDTVIGSGTGALVFSAAIPAGFRPATMNAIGSLTSLVLPQKVKSNGVWIDGSLSVDPATGNFSLGPVIADGSQTNFTTSGGFFNVSAVWSTRAWS